MNVNPARIINYIVRKIANNKFNNASSCDNCDSLRNFYEAILSDPAKVWLYQNREERMDALIDIFNESRRQFHLERYNFTTKFSRNKVIADIACGTGYGTDLLKRRGNALKVYGVDICSEAINYANMHYSNQDVEYICSSGETTGLENETIDVVVSFETIEHVPNDLSLLKEFYRILKIGGILVCSTPNEWPIEIATHHVREYNRDSFCEILTKYFEIINLYNQNSGSLSPFNHDQPFGIIETTNENCSLAECYIAVCKKK